MITVGKGKIHMIEVTANSAVCIQMMFTFVCCVRESDLQIKKGDFVVILDTSMKNKWRGLVNQVQGTFPPWVVLESPSKPSSLHTISSNAANMDTSREHNSSSETTRSQTLLDLAKQAVGQDVRPQSGNSKEKVTFHSDRKSVGEVGSAPDGLKGNTTETDLDSRDVSSDRCATETDSSLGHRTLTTPPSSKDSMTSSNDQSNPNSFKKGDVTESSKVSDND